MRTESRHEPMREQSAGRPRRRSLRSGPWSIESFSFLPGRGGLARILGGAASKGNRLTGGLRLQLREQRGELAKCLTASARAEFGEAAAGLFEGVEQLRGGDRHV